MCTRFRQIKIVRFEFERLSKHAIGAWKSKPLTEHES